MRKLCMLSGIIFLIPLNIICQENKIIEDKVSKEIKDYRKSKAKKHLQEDTTIAKIAKYSNEQKFYKEKNAKGIIKEKLNNQKIYDHNIEVLSIKIKKTNEFNLSEIIGKNAKLKKAIDDNNYNRIGYSVIEDKNNYVLLIILTENYIKFSEVSYTVYFPSALNANLEIPPSVKIVGVTTLPDIYISKEKGISSNTESIKEKARIKIEMGNEKKFEIEFEYDSEEIYFFDSKGKTIAVIKNIIK